MKKAYLSYGIVFLAVIAIVAGVISYGTETNEKQILIEHAGEETSTSEAGTAAEIAVVKKEKDCSCCSDRTARLKEQIRKARERRMAARRASAKEVASQQTP